MADQETTLNQALNGPCGCDPDNKRYFLDTVTAKGLPIYWGCCTQKRQPIMYLGSNTRSDFSTYLVDCLNNQKLIMKTLRASRDLKKHLNAKQGR